MDLVNHIFPKENFRSRVTEYVKSITTNGPMALQVVKEIIDSTFALDEDQALAFEREKLHQMSSAVNVSKVSLRFWKKGNRNGLKKLDLDDQDSFKADYGK